MPSISRGFCDEALQYVKGKLSKGAQNRPRLNSDWLEAKVRVPAFRENLGRRFGPEYGEEYGKAYSEAWIRAVAIGAETAEAGNCGEHAAVAFAYLLNRGARPLDYMTLSPGGDHCFVLVGRKRGSDPTSPTTWGADAYVCDAWSSQVFHATAAEFANRQWKAVHSQCSVP